MKNEQTTRHLPPAVLEILSRATGARCREVRAALSVADHVFQSMHSAATETACVDCATLEQDPCPDQTGAVSMLLGMLSLIGVTGRNSGGYDPQLQRVAGLLERDRREFGPRKPRKPRKRPTKVPNTPT